jgi:type II secretory pathway pseudopilin PulG
MRINQDKSIKGFSILEMTLVLGVIGILIVAALNAKPLIMNAKATRTINDLQTYMANVQMYTENYGYRPGNDPHVGNRFDLSGTSVTGGRVGGPIDEERIWQHLRIAGFVKGNPSDLKGPTNAFGGVFAFKEYAFNRITGGLKGGMLCVNHIPGDVAAIMDNKIDDGFPDTGSVMASANSEIEDEKNVLDYSSLTAAEKYLPSEVYIVCVKM